MGEKLAYTVAAACLATGYSRGRIHQLLREGELEEYIPPKIEGWSDLRAKLLTAESVERVKQRRAK